MKRLRIGIVCVALVAGAFWTGQWWAGRTVPSLPRVPETAPAKPQPRILYYRNPMGLNDISSEPKKDLMRRDYVPVYEGQEPHGPNLVKVSVDKVQKLGVTTAQVTLRDIVRTVRALGTVQPNERLLYTVAPRFEGYIEELYVNTTGQSVKRWQALMEVHSPELITAQTEYLIARRGVQALREGRAEAQTSMQDLAESTLQRLRYWEIAEEELRRLQREGKPRHVLTLRSPADGVVLEKPVVQGMRFTAGEMLYRIADLSTVWLIAEVFEQDLGLVREGQLAKIRVIAYPDKVFTGKVVFIYPVVSLETRTAKVRIELPNSGSLLKPAMYANVELVTSPSEKKVLGIPDSAVLDSGTRQLVLVQRGEGLFEPRQVKLGMRADGYVEVLDGLQSGDSIVVSANFLIDAESNLNAALGSFGGHVHGDASKATPEIGSMSAPHNESEPGGGLATPRAPGKVGHGGH